MRGRSPLLQADVALHAAKRKGRDETQLAQAIGERLGISEKTVNTYRHRIFEKTGVGSNVALTRLAFYCGLFAVDEREAG